MHAKPQGSTAVYLDVSGSMNAELQRLATLLHRHREWLRLPLWAFSDQVTPAQFKRGCLVTRTTGGTSLPAVFRHLATQRPEKALIITDGFVGNPQAGWAEEAARHRVEFLISEGGTDRQLLPLRRPISRLAAIPDAGAATAPLKSAVLAGRETHRGPPARYQSLEPI
jgi:hypothetical protein